MQPRAFNTTENKLDFFSGRGGGQVVSVLALYSDDTTSNPAVVYNYSAKLYLKSMKKRSGLPHLKKIILFKKA